SESTCTAVLQSSRPTAEQAVRSPLPQSGGGGPPEGWWRGRPRERTRRMIPETSRGRARDSTIATKTGPGARSRPLHHPSGGPPCNLRSASSGKDGAAVMRGSSSPPWASKPGGERGAPRIDPSIPNSRRGRRASPLRQGRDEMEITVGIDVSKARLDVFVHPAGESFALGNDEAGVAELVLRLGHLAGLVCIGIEASGRYERLAVAELAAAGLPVVVLNPAQVRHYAQAIGQRAKTDP